MKDGFNVSGPMTGARIVQIGHAEAVTIEGLQPELSVPSIIGVPPAVPRLVGRENDLAAVQALIRDSGSIGAIVGIGGVGKSALASYAIAPMIGDDLTAVWIDARSPSMLASRLSLIPAAAGLSVRNASGAIELAQLAVGYLDGLDREWILVLDNATPESADALVLIAANRGRGKILVTSRHSDWLSPLEVPLVRLGALAPDDGAELLMELSRDTTRQAALEIANRLGGVPQLLVKAASVVRRSPTLDLDSLLLEISNKPSGFYALDLGEGLGSVFDIWRIDSVVDEDRLLVAILALVASPGVEAELLELIRLEVAAVSSLEFQALLGRLVDESIIEGSKIVRINEVVADVLWRDASDIQTEAFQVTLAIVAQYVEQPAADSDRWDRALSIIPIVVGLTDRVQGLDSGLRSGCVDLAVSLGLALLTAGDSYSVQMVVDSVSDLIDDSEVSPQSIRIRGLRAWMADVAGEKQHALNEFDSLAREAEDKDTISEQDALFIANHRGRLLADLNRTDEALGILTDTWERRANLLGERHRDTLITRNNIGLCHRRMGDLGTAVAIFEEVYADRRDALGPYDIDTFRALNNIGVTAQRAGDYRRAENELRKCLFLRVSYLGPLHPDALSSKVNLAIYLTRFGDMPTESVKLLRQAYAGRSILFGSAHPLTVRILGDLAEAQSAAGRHRIAVETAEEFVAQSKTVEEEDSIAALQARLVLGRVQQAADLENEALATYLSVIDAARGVEDARGVLGAAYNGLTYGLWKSRRPATEPQWRAANDSVALVRESQGSDSRQFHGAVRRLKRISPPGLIFDRFAAVADLLEEAGTAVTFRSLVRGCVNDPDFRKTPYGSDDTFVSCWLSALIADGQFRQIGSGRKRVLRWR